MWIKMVKLCGKFLLLHICLVIIYKLLPDTQHGQELNELSDHHSELLQIHQ